MTEPQVFQITPPDRWALWLLLMLPTGLLLLFGYFLFAASHLSCTVTNAGIRFRGSGYGRFIPWTSIDRHAVQVVDLDEHPEWTPTVKVNGIGLPRYHVGWFTLENGRRALLFLTTRTAAYVPTSDGYVVLVSAEDPKALVSAIASVGTIPG